MTEIQTPHNPELEPLTNAVNYIGLSGLHLNEWHSHDRRIKIKMYYLTLNGNSISPKLNYANMNHFILGFSRGVQVSKQI